MSSIVSDPVIGCDHVGGGDRDDVRWSVADPLTRRDDEGDRVGVVDEVADLTSQCATNPRAVDGARPLRLADQHDLASTARQSDDVDLILSVPVHTSPGRRCGEDHHV